MYVLSTPVFPSFSSFFRFTLHLPQAGSQTSIEHTRNTTLRARVYGQSACRAVTVYVCFVVLVLRGIHTIPHRVYIQAFFLRTQCVWWDSLSGAHTKRKAKIKQRPKKRRNGSVCACVCVLRLVFFTRLLGLAIGSMARASSKYIHKRYGMVGMRIRHTYTWQAACLCACVHVVLCTTQLS